MLSNRSRHFLSDDASARARPYVVTHVRFSAKFPPTPAPSFPTVAPRSGCFDEKIRCQRGTQTRSKHDISLERHLRQATPGRESRLGCTARLFRGGLDSSACPLSSWMVSGERCVAAAGELSRSNMKEMIGGCCVCSDERGWAENPLVYCDGHGCNVAVHQGERCARVEAAGS